jgi:hypothetical protein
MLRTDYWSLYGGQFIGLQRVATALMNSTTRSEVMKQLYLAIALAVMVPQFGFAQSVRFGDNSSEWAKDGECDDRRFRGAAMASSLDADDTGKDRTDCKRGYDMGQLKIWNFKEALAATQCHKINFGDNKSDWPKDGECDDFRFEGPGTDGVMMQSDVGHDAFDCRKLCDAGQIALRNY